MKLEWKSYAVLTAVFGATLTAKLTLFLGPVWQELLSATVVLSPLGAIVRLVLDNLNHERQLRLQRDQQAFDLAASSHMASVVFDKHVGFCEAYLKAVDDVMLELGQSGEFERSLDLANQLTAVRRAHNAWIPSAMHRDLDRFESALREVGAKLKASEAMRKESEAEARKTFIEEAFLLLGNIFLQADLEKNTDDAEKRADSIRNLVRSLLKVEELVQLRDSVVNRSIRVLRGPA
ncbi:MAG: hypothetical protein Q8L64_01315 [bacterium]|nr:hypothetical protein [bacterium]